MKNLPADSSWQTHAYLFSVQVLFAILPTLAKKAFAAFQPETLACLRICGTALLMAPILFFLRPQPLHRWWHAGAFALFALFGVVGNQLLFLRGLSLTTAANASLLIATIPLFTLLIAASFRQERITLIKLTGILIALAGIAFLIDPREIRLGGYTHGNLLIIANAFLYSVYLVISKPLLQKYRPLTVITWVFIFGSLEMVPFTFGSIRRMLEAPPSARDWVLPVAIILFCTFLPYLFNAIALQRMRSTVVAIYTYLQPLLGTAFAVIWLHERLSFDFFLAAAAIFTGITLVTFGRLRRHLGKTVSPT